MRISATRVVLPLAVAGLVLAGCSDGTGGTPSPETTTAATSNTSKASPTTTSGSSGGSLASFDSCKALEAVAAQFNLTEIEAESKGRCGAEYSGTVSVSVLPWPDQGIEEATGAGQQEVSDTNIGSRAAKLIRKGASDTLCAVAVEVSETSRVDFVASANASLDEACEAATKVATAIEPNLPK